MPTVKEATTPDDIDRCFSVMHELRPHLDRAGYAAQVQRQMDNHGYRLVYVEADGEVVAAAGYRIAEWLAWGRSMYVDDLITSAGVRSSGHGGQLLDWMIEMAKREGCLEFGGVLVGGAELSLGPGSVFGQLSYALTTQTDRGLGRNAPGGLGLVLGYRIEIW